jgi:hypothetical protein
MARMVVERATILRYAYIAYLVFNIRDVSASNLVSEIGYPD